jgi:hypothetical protein
MMIMSFAWLITALYLGPPALLLKVRRQAIDRED